MNPDSLTATLDSLVAALNLLAISDRDLEALVLTVDAQVKNYLIDSLCLTVVAGILLFAIAYGCRSYFKYRPRDTE